MPYTRRDRVSVTPRTLATLFLLVLLLVGCRRGETTAQSPASPVNHGSVSTTPSLDPNLEILADFNRGAALLEQYQYAEAAEVFERVVNARPDWTAARFNLGLALLNQDKDSAAQQRGQQHLEVVLETDPTHRWAHFGLGVFAQFQGRFEQALEHFAKVHEADPEDLYVAYKYADVLNKLGRNDEAIKLLERIVERDPGFLSGTYRLFSLYNLTRQREKAVEVVKRFQELRSKELTGGSYAVGDPYAAMGRYYMVLSADGQPAIPKPAIATTTRLVFGPEPHAIGKVPLEDWSWSGGETRLPGVAVGDLDGDSDLDLVLVGLGDSGAAVVALNDGKGRFEIGEPLAKAATSPCLGDIDNDGDLDLWLGRAGEELLLLNDGKAALTQAPVATLQPAGISSTLSTSARLVDLDQDGDLDLLSTRLARGDIPLRPTALPAPSLLLNNNLDSTYTSIAPSLGLDRPETSLATLVADDFDNDRDLDLMLVSPTESLIGWENFRVGRSRTRPASETGLEMPGVLAATTGDPFQSGLRDVLAFSGDRIRLFRNRGHWSFEVDAEFDSRFGALGGTGGQFVDIDNDGDLDLLIPDARRKDGTRGPELLLNSWPDARFIPASELDAGLVLSALETEGSAAAVAGDFDGNGTCDILWLAPGQKPLLIENRSDVGHWLALDLVGKQPPDSSALSPASAIGSRVELRAGPVSQQFVVGSPAGATAMPPLRLHAGLGTQQEVQWIRVLWPDSILQAELEQKANRVLALGEINRRPSSCPHLFAWDGRQFAFVSDFGGVGGLGYLVSPGVYASPDSTEYLRLPHLEPRNGEFVLQIVEPLEEVVYLDEARLLAVDHPSATEILPREMAAVSAPFPPFEIFCFGPMIQPVSVTDHRGKDVTLALLDVDRVYPGNVEPDSRFGGYARQHALLLDFGDRLDSLRPGERPVLVLDGWVEYSTSTSNNAASQAGLRLEAPTLQVQRDGHWIDLARDAGYPAGINHSMTLDLTGLLQPGDRRFRVSTNMDISWDHIAMAVHEQEHQMTVQELSPTSADLHFLGYPREYSPDGRRPNLLDYSNIDRSDTWLHMPGAYTTYGRVDDLVQATDDHFVVFASGDELTLSYPASTLRPVPPGQKRTFLFMADSYCKDMDLYTATGDDVEPLPFHGMPSYPYNTRIHRQRYEPILKALEASRTRILGP